MWGTVMLAVLAAAGNSIGKVLQKKGTKCLPRFSFNTKVLAAYASSRVWAAGTALDIAGALLMVLAVSQAPISVVQPVSGCGLAIMALFSHIYLRERLLLLDWLGIALATLGTIGVGSTGNSDSNLEVSLARLFAFAAGLLLFLAVVDTFMISNKGRRRPHELGHSTTTGTSLADVVEEALIGSQAGACFGLSAATSRSGFLLAKRRSSSLYIIAGLSISILLTLGGFVCQTRGFKSGRAVIVSTCAAVAAIVTGVLFGLFALGEPLPHSSSSRIIQFGSWLCITMGVVLMLSSSRNKEQLMDVRECR